MPTPSRRVGKLALAASSSLAVLAAAAAPAGAVASKTLNYQCRYPLLGIKALSVKIDLDIPSTWPAGQTTNPFKIYAVASAADMRAGLESVTDLKSIVGTATAFATVKTAQGFSIPAKTVTVLDRAVLNKPIPDPLPFIARGQTPPLNFDEPGVEKITLDRLALNLAALDASDKPVVLPAVGKDIDGNPVSDSDGNPNTFDAYCKLDAGQDTTLGSFTIFDNTGGTPFPTASPSAPPTPFPVPTPAPGSTPTKHTARFQYTMSGSTSINTLTKGSMPLTGTIDATVDVATGDYTAETKLNDTQGRLTALGFLPVTVGIGIVPSGPTTGRVVDDQITASLKARIKVKSAKAFGAIPLISGNECQTKQLTQIDLKSTGPFDPTRNGGTIGGTFAIGDLNGCGILGGLVSPLTAGGGNTITASLKPILN